MYRVLALGVLAIAALPGSACAETVGCTSIASLPAVITSPGSYCLTKDLASSNSSGAAIQIDASNVTLDCNGYRVGGLAAGPATAATGILALQRHSLIVRNCNVRGFQTGVRLDVVGYPGEPFGLVVEDNRLDGNTHRGIVVNGPGSVVRRNLVTDTGGNPFELAAAGITVQAGTDVIDNTVEGVADAAGVGSDSTGILVLGNAGATVVGNRVRNVSSSLIARGYFIGSDNGDVLMRGNVASMPGASGSTHGYECATSTPTLLVGNVSIGFADAFTGCLDGGGNASLVAP